MRLGAPFCAVVPSRMNACSRPQRFDYVEVRADRLAAEHGTLLVPRTASRHSESRCENRLATDNGRVVHARRDACRDLVVGFVRASAWRDRHRQRGLCRDLAVTDRSIRRAVQHTIRRGGALGFRHAPLRGRGDGIWRARASTIAQLVGVAVLPPADCAPCFTRSTSGARSAPSSSRRRAPRRSASALRLAA